MEAETGLEPGKAAVHVTFEDGSKDEWTSSPGVSVPPEALLEFSKYCLKRVGAGRVVNAQLVQIPDHLPETTDVPKQ